MEAAQTVTLLQVGPCWAFGWRPLTYDQEGQVDGFVLGSLDCGFMTVGLESLARDKYMLTS